MSLNFGQLDMSFRDKHAVFLIYLLFLVALPQEDYPNSLANIIKRYAFEDFSLAFKVF